MSTENEIEKVKLLIIGSGPSGYTAAIYAARADLKPVLYQGLQPGGQLMITTEVENYPGYPEGVMGPKMMQEFEEQAKRMGADIRWGYATQVDFSVQPYRVQIDEEKWIEALNCIRKAIKLNEHVADYWLILADLEYKIGNTFSCIEAFEKAAELEPDYEEVWLKWSLVMFDQGQFDKAYEIIQEGLDDIPDNASMYYRATAYLLHAGEYKEALIHLEIALALNYEAHEQLYDFFPDLEKQKALFKLIEQYRK